MECEPRFVGHRLSAVERRDWRFVAATVGALVVLLSYCLPMFTHRIAEATVTFSKGTTITNAFPVFIYRQLYAQTTLPKDEELRQVHIRVEQLSPVTSLGWGWLGRIVLSGELGRHFSLFLCLLAPILSAILMLVQIAMALRRAAGLPELLVIPNMYLAVLGLLGLVLAWLQQFDFSAYLLSLQPAAFRPGFGFWLALVGMGLLATATWGLRGETRRKAANWWILVFVVAFSTWLLTRVKPHPFLEIWDFLFDGILVTLRLVIVSFGFILVVSLLGGLGRISRSRIIYGLASLYVEVIRGIPLLVQLLFIWFALPQVFDVIGRALTAASPGLEPLGQWFTELRLDPFTAAVIGFTICYGAYGSEIFRAGISSIHHGQMEAARSLGMTYVQAMRYIILPQAIRVILPPIGNEFVALLKDSSLVSVLAVSDLTRRGREYMARTFLSFDTWTLVALCYLVLTLFSSRVVEFIESKSKFER